jgi:predicted ATPase
MLRDLAGGRADGSWEPRLRRYPQNDVLILDDFGMRELTPTQAEDLYELICAKFRTGSMIVTSNRAPTDWYALFPNAVLAESALDRLVNSAHYVFFKGRTYRPLRRPDGAGSAAPLDGEFESHQLDQLYESRAAETAQDATNEEESMPETWARPAPSRARRTTR